MKTDDSQNQNADWQKNVENENDKDVTQEDVVKEYFEAHPNVDVSTAEFVDWCVPEYERRTGKKFRDPDRICRELADEGYLFKVKKGVYKYDPANIGSVQLEDFTDKQREAIFKRDGYKCVVCGRGVKDGETLNADHIKSRQKGGENTIENGQTLCGHCNDIKKNFEVYTFGKKLFVNYRDKAKINGDTEIIKFCEEVLAVFEKYHIDEVL